MTDVGGRADRSPAWGEALGTLVLGLVAAAISVGVLLEVPSDVVALHAVAVYSALAAAISIALAVLLVTSRTWPTLHHAEIAGHAAEGVNAWPWNRRYDLALDVGLALAAGTVAVIGVLEGGGWVVPGLLVGLVGLWFAGRVALSITGRRSNDGLWVTADDVVVTSLAGRSQCPRAQVRRVRATQRFVVVEGAVVHQRAPWPWRARSAALTDDELVFDTHRVGHTAEELADWLRGALSLEESSSPRRGTR